VRELNLCFFLKETRNASLLPSHVAGVLFSPLDPVFPPLRVALRFCDVWFPFNGGATFFLFFAFTSDTWLLLYSSGRNQLAFFLVTPRPDQVNVFSRQGAPFPFCPVKRSTKASYCLNPPLIRFSIFAKISPPPRCHFPRKLLAHSHAFSRGHEKAVHLLPSDRGPSLESPSLSLATDSIAKAVLPPCDLRVFVFENQMRFSRGLASGSPQTGFEVSTFPPFAGI